MTASCAGRATWVRLALLVAVAGNAGCTSSRDGGLVVEARSTSAKALYARSSVLWPVANGRATVRVCWLPLELGGETFPAATFAPDLTQTIPLRKAWTREIVETAWNALTPLDFVGWQDCDGSSADVRLRPISSAYTPPGCGSSASGQSCAEGFGTDLWDGNLAVNLNLMFGDETRYSSRYEQSAPGSQYNPALDLPYWWLPSPCLADFRRPWTTNNSQTTHSVDINDPSVSAAFDATYKACLQYNVLHELGHAAGFAHEQYRPDDAAKQADCYAYERSVGLVDDAPSQIASRYQGTLPLGPFDSESIMSYCRRDFTATLSAEDIAMTAVAYGQGGADGGTVSLDGSPPNDGRDAGVATSDGGEVARDGSSDADGRDTGPGAPDGDGGGSGCSVAAAGRSQPRWDARWVALSLVFLLRRRQSRSRSLRNARVMWDGPTD